MDFSVLISEFPTLTVDGIALGFIYVLIALGYTMVYGVLRLINFANSEVFMLGTFASIFVATQIFSYTLESEPFNRIQVSLYNASDVIRCDDYFWSSKCSS